MWFSEKKFGRPAPRNPVFSGVEVPGEAEILKIFKLMWVKKKNCRTKFFFFDQNLCIDKLDSI